MQIDEQDYRKDKEDIQFYRSTKVSCQNVHGIRMKMTLKEL